MESGIFIGKAGENAQTLNPAYANRHGLIAGATGTGKTVTLQIMAEGFAQIGVPVFVADVKGDLAGLSQAGQPHPKLDARAKLLGLPEDHRRAFSCVFWDLFGQQGHPVRATVSDMGPLLLSRLMELNDTQTGVLRVAFEVADEEGLLLLDLKDLRAMLTFISENAKQVSREYGHVTNASIGAIQRRLLELEQQGAEQFFGEPALELSELMRTDLNGEGLIHVLAADRLMQHPDLYATFLLWLLAELFEQLPEVGDPDRPRLVLFFDEAHLLFDDAPEALIEKIEQVVRLIRSKGVGVFFVTQNPLDLPDTVLGQLGNRVQHALRAFTPREQKSVRAAADTFRPNPDIDTRTAITQMGVGEALVSTLEKKGIPGMVQQTLIRPPHSRLGPITAAERSAVMAKSPVAGKYEKAMDRESAHEVLLKRAEQAAAKAAEQAQQQEQEKQQRSTSETSRGGGGRKRQGVIEAMVKSMARSVGSSLGRKLMRGILGSLLK